ncbi:hypothetical protein AB2762_02710, partial [Acinetobacter indicus]
PTSFGLEPILTSCLPRASEFFRIYRETLSRFFVRRFNHASTSGAGIKFYSTGSQHEFSRIFNVFTALK